MKSLFLVECFKIVCLRNCQLQHFNNFISEEIIMVTESNWSFIRVLKNQSQILTKKISLLLHWEIIILGNHKWAFFKLRKNLKKFKFGWDLRSRAKCSWYHYTMWWKRRLWEDRPDRTRQLFSYRSAVLGRRDGAREMAVCERGAGVRGRLCCYRTYRSVLCEYFYSICFPNKVEELQK